MAHYSLSAKTVFYNLHSLNIIRKSLKDIERLLDNVSSPFDTVCAYVPRLSVVSFYIHVYIATQRVYSA